MREVTFMIITVLADDVQRGCGIIGEVAEVSGGRSSHAPWAVHGLNRLRAQGLANVDREENRG
jgi:hypothetical protein